MRDTPQERATFAKKKAAAVGGLGHFQTWAREVARSALLSRTDVASRASQVRKVPLSDIRRHPQRRISRDDAIFCQSPFEGSGPRYTVERLVLHSVVRCFRLGEFHHDQK
jgi:hypothetical protein